MNKAKRKAIIAGNWKMNKTATEAAALIGELVPAVKNAGCEVVICTPFTSLCKAVELCRGTNIHVGAENVHFEKAGHSRAKFPPVCWWTLVWNTSLWAIPSAASILPRRTKP